MAGKRSLLLSLVVTLFLSVSSVWAKNVTVAADDPLLVYSNQTTPYYGGWQFNATGVICANEGGVAHSYAYGEWVSLQFNGTAVFVVLAEYLYAGISSVTIDGVQVNITARNDSYGDISSSGCHTRTLYATNLTNTNHTVNLTQASGGGGRTVLNKFIFDDGSETPIADPTATRAPVTISDTGATATPTYSSSSSSDGGGFDCGNGCKATSIGGIIGLIFTAIFMYWLWKCCCCGGSRKTVTETVYVERPASPKPQAIVVVAAAVEVQQTNVQVTAVDRTSAVIASPPAYTPPARDQTNYR